MLIESTKLFFFLVDCQSTLRFKISCKIGSWILFYLNFEPGVSGMISDCYSISGGLPPVESSYKAFSQMWCEYMIGQGGYECESLSACLKIGSTGRSSLWVRSEIMD